MPSSDPAGRPPVESLPAESGIEEIVPGLHRLRTPMVSSALPWIMPYAFEGPEGVSLFDSGYGTPEAQQALTDQLGVLGYAPSDVRRLIVSHAHPDHIGMARWLKEQAPGCELVMIGVEADWHASMDDREWRGRNDGWLLRHGITRAEIEEDEANNERPANERPGWRDQSVQADVRLEDGDVLEFDGWTLQAVWTPGHTPGHLCLYEPNHRLTFTGDHVLGRITPHISHADDDDQHDRLPLRDFRASLAKVAALDTRLGLPAHERLIEDLPARCHAINEHHEHRLDEVRHGIEDRPTPALSIAGNVQWNKPWSTFNLFKKRQAVGETIAHLELLRYEDRVRRIEDGDQILWERV